MDTLFGKDVNPSRILNALLLDRFDHSRANRFFSTPWLCSIWPSPHCHLGGNTFPLLMATLDRCFCAILVDAFRDQQLFLSHEEDMNIIQVYIYIYKYLNTDFLILWKKDILYKRFKKTRINSLHQMEWSTPHLRFRESSLILLGISQLRNFRKVTAFCKTCRISTQQYLTPEIL